MITQMKAKLAIDAQDAIGEGPTWDLAGKRLLWSDHKVGIIHEGKSDGVGGWRESRRWNLARPLAATIPRAKGGLVVAGGTEIFMIDEAGTVTSFTRIDADPDLIKINDAKCDPQGRLWAGTLTGDFRPGGAALYRIDPDGTVTTMLEGVTLSNGLDWSPGGETFYYVDSLTRRVDAFDFDPADGTIANRRIVVTFERGVPNGMAVDREGCLWVAATGGGDVQRYTPDGKLLARVEISTPGATSCAFGGPDGGTLFITSRRGRMPDVARTMGLTTEMMENNGPEAGGVFVCQPGPTGAPATPFAG
jgi:sugar lactone lactonase YvrE